MVLVTENPESYSLLLLLMLLAGDRHDCEIQPYVKCGLSNRIILFMHLFSKTFQPWSIIAGCHVTVLFASSHRLRDYGFKGDSVLP